MKNYKIIRQLKFINAWMQNAIGKINQKFLIVIQIVWIRLVIARITLQTNSCLLTVLNYAGIQLNRKIRLIFH